MANRNSIHQDKSNLWSTSGHNDPFGYWHDAICSNYTALTAQRLDENRFFGEIAVTKVIDDCTMSVIHSGPQIVQRTKSNIDNSPTESVFVNLQLEGESVVRQRGIEARVPQGSLVLLDARRPFEMKFQEDFRQVCLHLPHQTLQHQNIPCADLIARVVSSSEKNSHFLFQAMLELAGGYGDHDTVATLVEELVGNIRQSRQRLVADQHLSIIKAYVRKNAGDRQMCPAKTARHFQISVRYVHKLFARSNQTFGKYLQTVRLEKAKSLILRGQSTPLKRIAEETGFSSASHFSRAFKAAYDISPGHLRIPDDKHVQ